MDPFKLSRPKRERFTREYSDDDPVHGKVSWKWEFEEPGAPEHHIAADRRNELEMMYVHGANGEPPLDFPPLGDGTLIKVTRSLLSAAATLETMCVGPMNDDGSKFWSAERFVAVSATKEDAWLLLLDVVEKGAASVVPPKDGEPDPKSSAAAGSTS